MWEERELECDVCNRAWQFALQVRACFAANELSCRAVKTRKARRTVGCTDPSEVVIGALGACSRAAFTRVGADIAVEAAKRERLAQVGLEAPSGARRARSLACVRLIRAGGALNAGSLACKRLLEPSSASGARGQEANGRLDGAGGARGAVVHSERGGGIVAGFTGGRKDVYRAGIILTVK